MSMRGPGHNAGRNKGGRIGPDGLRQRERELLAAARAGEPLSPEHGVMLLERIGRMRHGFAQARQQRLTIPEVALAEAYDELSSAFVLLVHDRELLEDRVGRAEAEIDRRVRASVAELRREMSRIREERDDYRQAARDADASRLALHRVIGLGEALHA